MIYTCTMNPAIDLFIATKEMKPFVVNRTLQDEAQPNGKGVNISFVLKMLGIENTALGFIGGFTGTFIEEELNKQGIGTDFVKVEGTTRINVFTNVEEEGVEYKLVNKGPEIPPQKVQELLGKIKQLGTDDTLFVSGSNPRGVDDQILLEIAKLSNEQGFRLILDSSSPMVLECLPFEPYLVKPNEEELAHWFGLTELSMEERIEYGQKLLELGAQRVLVSLGAEGSLLLHGDQVLHVNAPKGKVVNTACSGDTLLGTFAGLLKTGWQTEDALVKASAAASSTTFRSGLTDFSDVDELMKELTVTKLKTRIGERKEWQNTKL